MGAKQSTKYSSEKARIEISAELLEKLIYSGILPGGECKCLNNNARNVLWQTLLSSSLIY